MKNRIVLGLVAALFGTAAVAAAPERPAPPVERPPMPTDRPPPWPGAADQIRADHHLAEAYESLTLASLCMNHLEGKDMLSPLLDSAKELYRTAHKAYEDRDYQRAAETAAAANDAGHGILHFLEAGAEKQTGLPVPPLTAHHEPPPPGPDGQPPRGPRDQPPAPPGVRDHSPPPPPARDAPPPPRGDRDNPPPPPPPPPGRDNPPPPPPGRDAPPPRVEDANASPEAVAQELIQHVSDRLERAGSDVKGPGGNFLDGAHKALDLAKQAQKAGDFFKATEMARAADAWSHVAEHLQHAAQPGGDRPPDRPRPPGDRPAPPPRPPSNA